MVICDSHVFCLEEGMIMGMENILRIVLHSGGKWNQMMNFLSSNKFEICPIWFKFLDPNSLDRALTSKLWRTNSKQPSSTVIFMLIAYPLWSVCFFLKCYFVQRCIIILFRCSFWRSSTQVFPILLVNMKSIKQRRTACKPGELHNDIPKPSILG